MKGFNISHNMHDTANTVINVAMLLTSNIRKKELYGGHYTLIQTVGYPRWLIRYRSWHTTLSLIANRGA